MKKLLFGLIIGLTVGISANAFAAIGDSVQAVFASFNYVVNGSTTTANSPVLVYEGVSYLRTTDIGNMLGFDVTYKADSRTIEFNNPEQVLTSTTTPTGSMVTRPEPTSEPTPTPVGQEASPTPTPDPNATPSPTPDPNATPAPSSEPTASPDPSATATPTPAPTVEPSPTPTPAPSNVAQCQAIRNDYAYQIAYTKYYDPAGGNDTVRGNKVLVLEYQENAALAAAGCN